MTDGETTVAVLREKMARFVNERDWEQFHSPKDLTMALAVEAAELMEPFLWMDAVASREIVRDPARLEEVADEIADVACLVLALCNRLGVDLSSNIDRKMAKNALKYPVDKCKGRYRVAD
jgi:NTP pyrophosphatase (non-canonical NTP hydrolase)